MNRISSDVYWKLRRDPPPHGYSRTYVWSGGATYELDARTSAVGVFERVVSYTAIRGGRYVCTGTFFF